MPFAFVHILALKLYIYQMGFAGGLEMLHQLSVPSSWDEYQWEHKAAGGMAVGWWQARLKTVGLGSSERQMELSDHGLLYNFALLVGPWQH